MHRLLLAVIPALLLTAVFAGTIRAQTTPQPDSDDLQWAFTPLGPTADQRIRMAFALLIDADLAANQAGLPASTRLLYGEEDIRSFLAQGLPAAEAMLLLDAAAARNPDTGDILLAAPRACQVGSPAFDASSAVWQQSVAQAREALAKAIPAALASLGISAGECELTDDPSQADILVWGPSQSADAYLTFSDTLQVGFLDFIYAQGGPVTQPGGQGGGEAVGGPLSPGGLPNTGSGGLAAASSGSVPLHWIAIYNLIAAAIVAAAVGLRWRERSR